MCDLKITWGAGATEAIHKVMACGPILARIGLTVIHIKLTVLSLETLGAVTRICANQILACGTILTWCRLALVDFILAVASSVTNLTLTTVAVAYVITCPIVAEVILCHTCKEPDCQHCSWMNTDGNITAQNTPTFAYSCITAGNHLYITHLACPAWSTHARVHIIRLFACCLVHARFSAAPVNIRVTALSCVAIGTVACVILNLIMTSGPIKAWVAVTLIDAILTVGACVPVTNVRYKQNYKSKKQHTLCTDCMILTLVGRCMCSC